jgi:hypothetical protein
MEQVSRAEALPPEKIKGKQENKRMDERDGAVSA